VLPTRRGSTPDKEAQLLTDDTHRTDDVQESPVDETLQRHIEQQNHFDAKHLELVAFLEKAQREFQGFYEYVQGAGESDMVKLLHDAVRDTVRSDIWMGYLGETFREYEQRAQTVPDGFVYILQAGEYYKIGRSKDLSSRIKTLKIQLPFEVRVLNAFPCENAALTESHLHGYYARYRVNGEWFRFTKPAAVRQLAAWRYSTVMPAGDRETYGSVDLHEEVPAVLWASPKWSAAMTTALVATERPL
jgi:hypothetical protein